MNKQEAIAVLEKEASIIDDDSIEMTAREWDEFDDLKREAIPVVKEALKAQEWIPIKWHSITDEERERECYPKDWVVFLDSDMPADGEEILVTTKHGYVEKDVCCKDGEYSLDSGWDWIEDIVAWMPLPEPYKESDKE